MTRHFYRFDTTSELGKQFRRLWNECNKAERAAEVFAKKVGAKTYYSTPAAFAGGVECVSFADGARVDKRIWRSVGKDADGLEQWVPDVRRRSDVMVLPRRDFRPSDTACRIYDRRVLAWHQVRHLHSLEEWAALINIKLEGDKDVCSAFLDTKLGNSAFVRYIELWRDDDVPADPTHPKRKVPYYQRESIRIERGRLTLPVVKMERFHLLFQADKSGILKDGKPAIVQESTPTFFEYGRRIYLGIDFPCLADGLEKLGGEAYAQARQDVLRMQRDMEALAESNEKGN